MSDSHFRSCYVISNLKRLPTALKGSLSESHRDFPMKTLSPTFTSPAFSTLMFTPKNGADPKTFFSSGSLNEINQDKTSLLHIYTELHLSAFIICVKPWYTDTFGGFSKAPRRCACHQLMGRPQHIYFSGVLFFNCSWLDCTI